MWAVEFAATPLLFGWLGHFLDGRLGTNPWLTILLVVFAISGLIVRAYYGYVAAMEAHEANASWAKVPARASADQQGGIGPGAQGPPLAAG